MSRASTIYQQFTSAFSAKEQILIIFDQFQLQIFLGEKLLYNQANCFIFHRPRQQILAAGKQALMWQKSANAPETSINLMWSLQTGAIADIQLFEQYLKLIFNQVFGKSKFFRHQLIFAHHSSLSPLEIHEFKRLLASFNFFSRRAIPMACLAALNCLTTPTYTAAPTGLETSGQSLVLYLGQYFSELSFVNYGSGAADFLNEPAKQLRKVTNKNDNDQKLLYSSKIHFGFEQILTKLEQFFLQTHQMQTNRQQLIKLISNITYQDQNKTKKLVQIKGKAADRQLIKVKAIPLKEIFQVLDLSIEKLIDDIQLEMTAAKLKFSNLPTLDSANCILTGPMLKKLPLIKDYLAEKLTWAFVCGNEQNICAKQQKLNEK